jgi:hypothetical protein
MVDSLIYINYFCQGHRKNNGRGKICCILGRFVTRNAAIAFIGEIYTEIWA